MCAFVMSSQSSENEPVIRHKGQHEMSEAEPSLTLQGELLAFSKLHTYLTLLKKPWPFKQSIYVCV